MTWRTFIYTDGCTNIELTTYTVVRLYNGLYHTRLAMYSNGFFSRQFTHFMAETNPPKYNQTLWQQSSPEDTPESITDTYKVSNKSIDCRTRNEVLEALRIWNMFPDEIIFLSKKALRQEADCCNNLNDINSLLNSFRLLYPCVNVLLCFKIIFVWLTHL